MPIRFGNESGVKGVNSFDVPLGGVNSTVGSGHRHSNGVPVSHAGSPVRKGGLLEACTLAQPAGWRRCDRQRWAGPLSARSLCFATAGPLPAVQAIQSLILSASERT